MADIFALLRATAKYAPSASWWPPLWQGALLVAAIFLSSSVMLSFAFLKHFRLECQEIGRHLKSTVVLLELASALLVFVLLKSIGLPPGSLVFIGDKKVEEMKIRLIDYDNEHLDEDELRDIQSGAEAAKTSTVTWINIHGLHDTERMQELGEAFDLHPLLLEYVLILTFQERPGDVFEPVRKRIRKSQGRIRISGPDYLAHSLLDTVVDNYIQIVESLGSDVEDLEVEVLSNSDPKILNSIHELKRELSFLRKSIRPARDAILQMSKVDNDLIQPKTGPFLKDLHDISSQAADAVDTYREMLSDELDIYNSTVSNKMNDIMKVLTIFAAIFIPLTFIAGVYGTNFEYLPELKYKYSYFIFLGVMVTVGIGMLAFFRRRGWL